MKRGFVIYAFQGSVTTQTLNKLSTSDTILKYQVLEFVFILRHKASSTLQN